MSEITNTQRAWRNWLLLGGSVLLVFIGLSLGWIRGLSGISDHSTKLATILTLGFIGIMALAFLFSWRHDAGGKGKLWSSLVGTLLGLVIIGLAGLVIAIAAAAVIVAITPMS